MKIDKLPEGMIENLDELIALEQKKVKLLFEMRRALQEEAADYIVCNTGQQSVGVGYHSRSMFIIVERKTKENLYCGLKTEVEAYIKKKRLKKVHWRTKMFFNDAKQIIELI